MILSDRMPTAEVTIYLNEELRKKPGRRMQQAMLPIGLAPS